METLCRGHRYKYIYWITYEVDSRKYEHYRDDLKVFGNNAEEIMLQVITTCTLAQEYNDLTGLTPDPYLPYMLWSITSQFDKWEVPTINDLTHFKYQAKCREQWKNSSTIPPTASS